MTWIEKQKAAYDAGYRAASKPFTQSTRPPEPPEEHAGNRAAFLQGWSDWFRDEQEYVLIYGRGLV